MSTTSWSATMTKNGDKRSKHTKLKLVAQLPLVPDGVGGQQNLAIILFSNIAVTVY